MNNFEILKVNFESEIFSCFSWHFKFRLSHVAGHRVSCRFYSLLSNLKRFLELFQILLAHSASKLLYRVFEHSNYRIQAYMSRA